MPSYTTALSLALAGEGSEIMRRARAYARNAPLTFPVSMDIAPAFRAETARAVAATKRLLCAGPSLRREGAPISQFELTLGLSEQSGFEISTFTAAPGPLTAAYKHSGLNIQPLSDAPKSMALPKVYEAGVQTLSEFLSARADLIYANTVDMFPVIDAARLAGIPSIWNIRESKSWRDRLGDRHPKIAARALACFDYPEAVIFVANSSRKVWERLQTRDNFKVIPNALRPDQFTAHLETADAAHVRKTIGAAANDHVILSVGTICDRKRQSDSIGAFAHMSPEAAAHMHWIFLGQSTPHEMARHHNMVPPALKDRVHFIDSVENPAPYYKAADIFVCASEFEAMPRTLLEAASASLPIVTTPAFGAGEIFTHGETALFFNVGDISGLSENLQTLVNAPSLAQRLGIAAKGEPDTAYADMIGRYLSELNTALAGSRACAE